MSDGANLWHDDGSPRRPPPPCPLCGADQIRSNFDDAWCAGQGRCKWRGTLTELAEIELRRRPGARLLEFLEARGLDLGDFAFAVGMASKKSDALSNIRRYTHTSPVERASATRSPTEAMVVRWAAYLGVDAGEFYRAKE